MLFRWEIEKENGKNLNHTEAVKNDQHKVYGLQYFAKYRKLSLNWKFKIVWESKLLNL